MPRKETTIKKEAITKGNHKKIKEFLSDADRTKFKSRVPDLDLQTTGSSELASHPVTSSIGTSSSTSLQASSSTPFSYSHEMFHQPLYPMNTSSPMPSYFYGSPYSPYTPFVMNSNAGASSSHEQHPFFLTFVKGNISRCVGCGLKTLKQANGKLYDPPGDICVQHKEHVVFKNPRSGNFQLSRDLRNVYYHAKFCCITYKHPLFTSASLIISSDVKTKLSSVHTQYVFQEFGLTI